MDLVWLETVLKNQQRSEFISKILDMKVELAVPKGENYCSIVTRATLDILSKSGKKSKKKVIIKNMPSGNQGIFVKEFHLFKKEVQTYSTILAHMEDLMEENGFKRDRLWCKLIGYKNNEFVVLEDLTEKGYTVINRRKMLDLDHATMVAQALGTYHAMSKVLLNRGMLDKEDFGMYPFLKTDRTIKMIYSDTLELMANEVVNKWGSEWLEIGKKLQNLVNGLGDKIKSLVKVEDNRFNVINHGDCWTTNLMFNHGPGGKPMSVKFIDFQAGHYNSFAWDLTYFMYNSIQPKIRRANRSALILSYYESLNSCLIKYGTPDNEIPTLGLINEEMNRIDFYGLLLLCTSFAGMSADTTDALDLESFKNGDEIAFNKEIFSNPTYINNIKDDLVDRFK